MWFAERSYCARRPSAQTVAVLRALAQQPREWRYGYDLCHALGLKAGSMYPILMRLADRGLLATSWETDVTAVGRSAIDAAVPPSDDDAIVGLFLTVTVVGTLSTTAFAAARAEQSFGAGVTASLWVGLVCSILAFNADVLAILVGFNLDAHMRQVMPGYYTALSPDAFLSQHIGGHLASAMEGLRTLPLLALICGSIGAAVGRRPRAAPDRTATEAS